MRLRLASRLQPYLLTFLACLALALLLGYDAQRERELAVAQARENTANLANLLSEYARQRVRRVELTLDEVQLVTSKLQNATDTPELSRALVGMLPSDTFMHGFSLAAVDGRVRLSAFKRGDEPAPLTPVSAGSDASAQPWFQQAKEKSGTVWGVPEKAKGGLWLWPVSRPLTTTDGQFAGVVVAWVAPGRIQLFFDTVNTGSNGFVTLFTTDGWMLATAPNNPGLFERNWADTPMFKVHLPRSPQNTVQQVVVRDGTERVYSYQVLRDMPLVMSVGVSMTDALAPWRVNLFWKLALLVLVSACWMGAAWALSRHYQKREAAELAGAAARQAAEQSERFLQQISDNIPLRIAYVGTNGRFAFLNQAHIELFGQPVEALVGRTPQEITGQPLPPLVQEMTRKVLQGEACSFEFEDDRGGRRRMIECHLVPDLTPEGRVRGYYAASADVTERHLQQQRLRDALAERETLLREVYHRVKNNLQVVQSLLNLQRRALPEGPARLALDDSAQRVRAMALVHEKLYQTGNLAAVALQDYTPDLLRQIAEALGASARGIALRSDVVAVDANLDVAVPYGLLVTELVGNSLKHGFPQGRSGEVVVRLSRQGLHLKLTVADNGVSLPEGFSLAASQSMGLQLASSLAGQLGGTLHAHNDQGAVFTAELSRLG
ncbi:MAG: histidine kinase dimerization/phosphoacceptor domain -containing protein [Burkholderiales bacterium]